MVLLMAFIPCCVEATTHAIIGMGLFNMPIEVSYSMGFVVSPVAAAIITPMLLHLNEDGYGREKGINVSIIASATFDNIVSLLSFGICSTITFQYAA